MKKLKKLICGAMLATAFVASPVSSLIPQTTLSVEAASYQNPHIWKCSHAKGYFNFYIYKGHKLKTVLVDGRDYTSTALGAKVYDFDLCNDPYNNGNWTMYQLHVSKGTHRVEVRDNKGYYVIDYVTVK